MFWRILKHLIKMSLNSMPNTLQEPTPITLVCPLRGSRHRRRGSFLVISPQHMIARILILLFSATLSTVAADLQSPTPAQNEWAKQFAFNGLRLRMTPADIQRIWPQAQRLEKEGDTRNRIEVWQAARHRDLKTGSTAKFFLLDQKVYEIQIYYLKDQLLKLGGWQPIYKRLVQNLGEPQKDSRGINKTDGRVDYYWYNADADTIFTFFFTEASNAVKLTVIDGELGEQATKRKQNLPNVGF